MSPRVLVYGLGLSGIAVVRHLRAEGVEVIAADDDAGERPRRMAGELGVDLVVRPTAQQLRRMAGQVDEVVVSPGVGAGHPVMELAGDVPVVGELELAWQRARVPVVAVTGTNGKTTVVTLVTAMLCSSGLRAVAGGNIGLPLLDVVSGDAEVVVAEASSFQLALTSGFHPSVGAWVNFAPDHLDWHPTLEHYRRAKARLWANAGPGDRAVANVEDPVVRAESEGARQRGAVVVGFGLGGGDYRLRGDELVGPAGALCQVGDLARPFPHEIGDALCAWATASAAGAQSDGCRRALRDFRGLPHRLELVREANGVRFFDDSKATTPDAVLAAVSSFSSAVLVAGGRNKGLDLSPLRSLAAHLKAVVAIGEAAEEIGAVFEGVSECRRACSMEEAVSTAAALAAAGDVVVLSPACSSFDWYSSYAERGEDFARWVRRLPAAESAS